MTKKLIRRVEELFVAKLQAKTGWGRNEVLALFKDAVAEAAMELLDGEADTQDSVTKGGE